MARHQRLDVLAVVLIGFAAGCANESGGPDKPPKAGSKAEKIAKTESTVVRIQPGPNVQEETQTALIKAKPGQTIEFGEGTFDFTAGLSLAVENVTIRGKGMDKTILSFKKQNAGKEGLIVTRGKFLIEDLTMEDTKGDATKVNDAEDVTFRRIKTQWTGGSKETNGAYGVYPVQCKNVLIDECVAIGASDAGIYVGQSQNVVIRKCRAERNVAGIEIENCTDAEAYDNVATDNAGGLLVFDLPGLQAKNGKRVRVYDNHVFANNHENFAPKGNMVASVAPGTGMIVMATDQVEAFKNTIKDNQTYNFAIVSFFITGRPMDDKGYDPYPEGIYVHDNTFSGGGNKPSGDRGAMLAGLLGTPIPDIVYDGIVNPAKLENGKMPPNQGVYLKNNVSDKGSATFANLHWNTLDPKDPKGNKAKVTRDIKPYEGELPALPPVKLARK
jgi:parallel beta-helix repeat protein